ncbi:MAG: NINE protein, partial [Bacteroidetes bacterium]
MKDKHVAGILAIVLGGFGIHQFYLNRPGWGLAHLFFTLNPRMWAISWLVAWATAIHLFSMDREAFDRKYNKKFMGQTPRRGTAPDFEREPRRRHDWRTRHQPNRRATSEEYVPPVPKQKVKANPYKQSGIAKFKDYDYDGAIEDFKKALEIAPDDIATHFNIACAYSLNEDAEKAFEHLDKAVRLGFKDFKRIKEHDALAFLRIQDAFEEFEANGFRLASPKAPLPKPDEDLLSSTPDLLDQLKKLGELKERGLLTEEEFA